MLGCVEPHKHTPYKSAETTSGNGALQYKTTGSDFVDQYSSLSGYKSPRPFAQISTDAQKLYVQNPLLMVMFTFFLRMITRVTQLFDGNKTSTVQRGGGLRHEAMVRMIWLHLNAPDTFWKNIQLYISIGSWKDVFEFLRYDLEYNGWNGRQLDWNKFGNLILAGLENPNTTNLVKKFLPHVMARSACTTTHSQANTMIAKWICSLLNINYKEYRKLKTSGQAHKWQQMISKKLMNNIDFNSIHGKALLQLVSSKFLANNKLEDKYQAWIESQPVAKFTGYVFELAQKISHSMKKYQKDTINAQFNNLIAIASQNLATQGFRPISVLDCSGSMDSPMYIGNGKVGKLKSIELAFSSAIFFNECMNKQSPFYDTFLSFSNRTEMKHFTGNSFVDKYQLSRRDGWGGTNFESVFDFFVDFKMKNPTISEDLIPNMIVCFSDGEFNTVCHNGRFTTNIEAGRAKLRTVYSQEFADNFGLCIVECPNTFYRACPNTSFETFGDVKNVFYFSGYDLSPLAFLFGVAKADGTVSSIPSTADELFKASMDQEILNMIQL